MTRDRPNAHKLPGRQHLPFAVPPLLIEAIPADAGKTRVLALAIVSRNQNLSPP
jgi:hypothetical protein